MAQSGKLLHIYKKKKSQVYTQEKGDWLTSKKRNGYEKMKNLSQY